MYAVSIDLAQGVYYQNKSDLSTPNFNFFKISSFRQKEENCTGFLTGFTLYYCS
jgi:hypothetical protein